MHKLPRIARLRPMRAVALAVPVATAVLLFSSSTAFANVALTQVSSDPFTDTQAQHHTQVEPDTFSFGNTIVSAFQQGRVFGGGAPDTGLATSTAGGAPSTRRSRRGSTTNVGGPYGQASDAAVAFDARHTVWLISSLGISGNAVDVLPSRSTNGGRTWSNPVVTATG